MPSTENVQKLKEDDQGTEIADKEEGNTFVFFTPPVLFSSIYKYISAGITIFQ